METSRATGLKLSDKELDEATRRLAFFAPSGAAEYVQDLFTFLAEQALAAMEPGTWRAVDIHAKLRKMTGIRVEYEELLAGLQRSAAHDTISVTANSVSSEHARFSMPGWKRDEIRERTAMQSRKEAQVIDTWKEEVAELYPDLAPSEMDSLERDLREYVYRIVSYSSVESVLLYHSGQKGIDSLASDLAADSIDEALPERSERLRDIRAEILPGFFRAHDPSRKSFIDGLLQSTFILHMIQLDPKCSAMVRAEIVGGTLYLDTNFVFRLFGLHSPEMFFATRELTELSRNLGYSMCFTPTTKEEYLHALRNYLDDLAQAPRLPRELMEMVVDLADNEDPIIAYYRKTLELSEGKQAAYVSPQVYYEYFCEIEALLEQWGITLDDRHCEAINKSNKLVTEASRLKRFSDDRRYDAYGPSFQELSPFIAEHDAFHRLLILKLRAGHDGAGFWDIPVWFLTCDSKLPAYDRIRRASEGLDTPFCVTSAQWLQTIRPFVPRVTSRAVAGSISSPLLRTYSRIPNSVILDVAGRLRLQKGHIPIVGRTAMKRQFLLSFAEADEDERQELIDNVFADYAQKVEDDKEEVEQALAESTEQVGQLKDKLLERTGERDAQKADLAELGTKLREARRDTQAEREARIRLETDLSQTNEEIGALRQELATLRSGLDGLSQRQMRWKKVAIALSIAVICTAILAVVGPMIIDSYRWLVLSGSLAVAYVSVLLLFHPYKEGRPGWLFTIGFPVLIGTSVSLHLGKGRLFAEWVGYGADACGLIAFLTSLLLLGGGHRQDQ